MQEYKEKTSLKIWSGNSKRHRWTIQIKKYLLHNYFNAKDKVPEYLKSQIVYIFYCTVCNSKYIGKTNRNFSTCVQQYSGSDKKSLVYNQLLECEYFDYVVNLHSLPPSNNLVEYLEHVKIAVYGNTKIIDNSQNRTELCFLESLHIKWNKPKLNCGIKATKEFVLFS